MNKNWVIVNTGKSGDRGLFWSNNEGWATWDDRTVFTENEHKLFAFLPLDSTWIEYDIAEAIVIRVLEEEAMNQ